jgi:hypothetical protein
MGVDGETVPDLSGNGLDAELGYEAQIGIGPALPNAPSWGHASPIETDASSREFWGWSNATSFGFTGTSYIRRDSHASMAPSPKDVTVEEWIRPMDNFPLGSIFPMAYKEGTAGTAVIFDTDFRIGGFCRDSAGTVFTVYDPSFAVRDHLGESFHVVVFRSGDALALYINGTLRNITTVTSGLPTQFTSDPFWINPQNLAYTNVRHDEVAYYDYALSGSRILAHYEAALNVLNMRGEANIRTTAVLSGTDEPDPIGYPFRHNWSDPVIERFRWRTSVFKPTNGATELSRLRSGLRRQVEYQHLLYNEDLRRRFEARSFAGRTALTQFEPDKVQVTTLSAGSTAATFDTQYMDFEVGHRALIYQTDDLFEYVTLVAVDNNGIEWSESLSRDYANPWIKPVRVARLPLEQEMDAHTDTIGEASTIYEYLPEDEPLSPRRVIPWTSTLTYRSREMFDLREWQGHNYSEIPTIEFVTDRSLLDSEVGIVSAKQYRWGAEQLQPYNMNLQGRELIAKYLGWLYERSGSYQPFWMPTFRQDLKPLSAVSDELTVSGHEYTNLYAPADNRVDLAFVYFDNTVTTRRIESSIADGDNDVLTLDAAVPTFTNLRWLSFLRRVILSSDDLEIAWETDNVVRVAFAVTDAPLDWAVGSPSVSPSPSASGSRSPSPSPSVSLSRSPSSSQSPSSSTSLSISPSGSVSPSASASPSSSSSLSVSPSGSTSPSSSASPSV